MIFDGDTPDLSTLLTQGARNVQQRAFSALPGTIKSFDPASGKASVSPVVRGTGGDGAPVAIPDLPSMPVWMPAGADAGIGYKPSPGDACVVVFSSVSASQWLTSGEAGANPESPRRQSLSDGIVFVGLRPFNDALGLLNVPGVDLALGRPDGSAPYLHLEGGGGWLFEVDGAERVKVGATSPLPVAIASLIFDELVKIANGIEMLAIAAGVPPPPLDPYYSAPSSAADIAATKLSSE